MTFAAGPRRYNLSMRRWLAVAALGVVFAAAPAWGQRRGGGFGGHAGIASHGATGGVRGPAMGFRRPGYIGATRAGARWGFGFRGGPLFGTRFYRYHRRFYPGWGWGYGYPWWYGDLGWYDNGYVSYYPDEQYYPRDDSRGGYFQNRENEQQAEIDRLEDEVGRLREEREAQQAHQHPEAKPETTELVFRDKRTEEIENYAIMGQTLWVLTEQRARKIPLVDLDIAATQKANQDRGVGFAIPR